MEIDRDVLGVDNRAHAAGDPTTTPSGVAAGRKDVGQMPGQDAEACAALYWRGGGTGIILNSLSEVFRILRTMITRRSVFYPRILEHLIASRNGTGSEEEIQQFVEISKPIWELDSRLCHSAVTAILMAVTDLESEINRLCCTNLGPELAADIECLSPASKMELVSRALCLGSTRGTPEATALKAMVAWRKAFAYGHCWEAPGDSPSSDNLLHPRQLPKPAEVTAELLALMRHYLLAGRRISNISGRPYSADTQIERFRIEEAVAAIHTFEFSQGYPKSRRRYSPVKMGGD